MKELAEALPWVAFWLFAAVYIYIEHRQYLQGRDTLFFEHKTPEELRIREAVIKKLEAEAKRVKEAP